MQYEIVIEYTKQAKKNIKKLHISDKYLSLIKDEVSYFIKARGKRKGVSKIDFPPELGFESTLYVFMIKSDFDAVLTIDEDPIFEQILVKVFSVGPPEKVVREINRIYRSLINQIINGLEDEEADTDGEENNGRN